MLTLFSGPFTFLRVALYVAESPGQHEIAVDLAPRRLDLLWVQRRALSPAGVGYTPGHSVHWERARPACLTNVGITEDEQIDLEDPVSAEPQG